MVAWFALAVSGLSLLVAALALFLTYFRTGSIRMTRPSVIFLGSDAGKMGVPKVFLRALLYATAKQGRPVENMFVAVARGETRQNFNVWVYGESGDLTRGSGLHIPPEGVALNHHFLLPRDGSEFRFLTGQYVLEVYITLPHRPQPLLVHTARIFISQPDADHLSTPFAGLYFDWAPNQQDYVPHQSVFAPEPNPFLDALMAVDIHRESRNPLGA